MADIAPSRLSIKDVITLGGALVSSAFIIGGTLRADGARDKDIDGNTRRIEVLERADQAKTDLLTKIDGRTIRIETKLEMMSPAKVEAK